MNWLDPEAVREWLEHTKCPEHKSPCFPVRENLLHAWEQFGMAVANGDVMLDCDEFSVGGADILEIQKVARLIRDAGEGK